MGLIKAALGAAGGVLADQWKEYFYCESIPNEVLMTKGVKRTNGRSSNTKGSDNIISNGSVIAVADGQCMIIVEQGKVVDLCAEPGEYTYDCASEPSLFTGKLSQSIKDVFKNIGKRFTFGGVAPMDQRVYYFNTKELMDNLFGTPAPVPFRVVDKNIGLDIDISIRCHGSYTYQITNPILFYTNVAGNVSGSYTRAQIDKQLKSELLDALQPGLARISEKGIRYSALPNYTKEISAALNEELSASWRDLRGIEIVACSIQSVKASEEDEAMIKELQRNATFRDPTMAAAHLVGAQASAMNAAAANTSAGPAMAFMGMNMASQAGGVNPQSLFQMGQQQSAAPAAPAADSWTCPGCGKTVSGKFCPECGAKKPAEEGFWTCSCGAKNKGKFCPECGAKKPAGERQYKCDKCGWEPADPAHPPKFCPECGDPFDEGDLT